MSAKVAPVDLKAAPGPPLPFTPLGGPGSPNGCCLDCCGALPAPINTQNILDDGGKFVKLKDGRILEYFVYGSEKKDARVLIELSGTGGTGKFFTNGEIPAKCIELNVKGIGITFPGHAYSTVNVGRRIIDFAADVDEVLKAEHVVAFMVEGSSYGVPHALALAWHYSQQDRVLAMHLHVPYLNNELARVVTPDTLVQSNPGAGTIASLQNSCGPFCKTRCICNCLACCGTCMLPDNGYPGSSKLTVQDITRSAVHSVYGVAFNNADEHCSNNWGFDAREIKLSGPNQVLVSYAEDDDACPPEHGRWLGEYFKATVNTKKEGLGHLSFAPAMLRGEFVEQLVQLVDSSVEVAPDSDANSSKQE